MALRFDEYIFVHVPRCGGNYVRRLVDEFANQNAIDLLIQEVGPPHVNALGLPLDVMAGHVSFCIVRHPLTWYISYFGYRLIKSWRDEPLDICCEMAKFAPFVKKALIYFSGYYTQMLSTIVPFVDFVIPLSMTTQAMEQIFFPLIKTQDLKMPEFADHKGFNTSSLAEFNRKLPKTIRQKFYEVEELPFKRLMMINQSKVWFQDQARKEFGFDAEAWVHA